MAAEKDSAPTPKRRVSRTAGTRATRATRAASGTRRRTGTGSEMVESLNTMVAELIKENRRLKRQLDAAAAKGTAAASSGIERGLRSIQRRVQKALSGTTTTRRRTTRAASSTPRRTAARRTTATRRRRASGESASS